MTKYLLLPFFFMLSFYSTAQYLYINAPEDCEGALRFSPTAAWGADLNSDVWTGDVAIVDDGTAAPTEGCNPLINGGDIAGKIAFVDRGSCNFSLKALNAQTAGAIAVIIANNIPNAGTFDMGAGNFATDVIIPAVMINYEDGQLLKSKMEMGTLNMSMGNLEFDTDLGVASETVLFPGYSTVPKDIADEAVYAFDVGAAVTNFGTMNGTNVQVETNITFNDAMGGSQQVHTSSGTVDVIEPDSSTLIVTGSYGADQAGEGTYEYTYQVSSDNADEVTIDNTFTETYSVTSKYLSKARWDHVNNRPVETIGFTIAGGGSIEMITPFEVHNATLSSDDPATVESVHFYVTTSLSSLASIDITIFLYQWDDADGDGAFASEEVELVAFGVHEFDDNETAAEAWVNAPIEGLISGTPGYDIPEGEVNLIVGTRYEGPDLVFFGFDQGVVLDEYINGVHVPNGTYSDAKLPYGQTTSFGAGGADFDAIGLFTDTWFVSSTSLEMSFPASSTQNLSEEDISARLLGNPVQDRLRAEVNLLTSENELIGYRIVNTLGQHVLFQKTNARQQDQVSLDVGQLASGKYDLVIITKKGFITLPFVRQ